MSQRHDHRYSGERGPYSQPPRQGRRGNNAGGGSRRNYDGGHNQAQFDPVVNVKHKLVKLGDQPERLLTKIRETGQLLDSFLTHDFRTYINSIVNEMPSPNVDNDGLAVYLQSQADLAFEGCRERLPSAEIVLNLLVECITMLPHKHSYYICLLWFMVHEALGGSVPSNKDGDDEVKSVKDELTDMFHRFSAVRVKGETADDVEVVALVDKPGGVTNPVKFEVSENRHVEQHDRSLFFLVIAARLQKLLLKKVNGLFTQKGGLHQIAEVYGAFRGLADFANVGLLNVSDFVKLCEKLVTHSAALSDPVEVLESKYCFVVLGGTSLMWLNQNAFNNHKDEVLALVNTTIQICEQIKATTPANTLLKQFDPAVAENTGAQYTNLDVFTDALKSLSSHWITRSLPRLYDSAKLTDLTRRVCFIPCRLNAGDVVLPTNWSEFTQAKYSRRYRMTEVNEDEIELWRQPPCLLQWRVTHHNTLRPYLPVLSEEYVKSCLEVELMRPCDVFILHMYIEQTVIQFFRDLDMCAETLLLIPCQHDQYVLVLINHIFEIFFSSDGASVCGLDFVNVMDGLLLSQLLRRMAILEKTLTPHIYRAVNTLIERAATLNEFNVSKLVDFISTWITSNPSEDIKSHLPANPYHKGVPALEASASAEYPDAKTRVVCLSYLRVHRLTSKSCEIPKQVFFIGGDDDASRCRTPAELPEIKRLEFAAKAPLESLLLRDLLRLQVVGGRREQAIIIRETVAVLKDLIGTKLMQNMRDFARNEMDQILFANLSDEGSLKTEAEGAGANFTSAPLVKAEQMMDEPVDDQAASDNEDEQVDESLRSALFETHPIQRFDDDDWVWDVRSLSKLLSMTVHTIGARTFSHLQKALELYTGVLKRWKTYLARQRLQDNEMVDENAAEEAGRESETLAFEIMLLDHAFQLIWPTRNTARLYHTVATLVNRDVVSFNTLVNYLVSKSILCDTVGCDQMFWELIDLMVNDASAMPCYRNSEISKNVMREYRRYDLKSETPIRNNVVSARAVKAEAPPSQPQMEETLPPQIVPDSFHNDKLTQEDLAQLLEAILTHLVANPNALMRPRIHRLLLIAHAHLNPSLFSQLLEKIAN